MTITNSFVAKLSVAFVAAAMALTLLAPAVSAQSDSELQSQIDDLLATIAALQGQLGGSTPAGNCTFTFTTAMGQGATGVEVMNLQKFLNMDPETLVAASGAGSIGMETQYYGPATAAAVSKFQVKYRSEVLTPLGLVNPTGYWGQASIAQANDVCGAMTGGDTDGDTDGDDEDEDNELDGGETSLEDFGSSDGDDTNLEEGQEEAEVAVFEFDVEDGDAMIDRIDVVFANTDVTNPVVGDTDAWDVFEEVAIYVDGEEIDSIDASDEDEWSEDEPTDDEHTLRFSGLDWVVNEGETAEFSVVVTVAGSVDDADTGVEWSVYVDDEGIRAVDGEGVQNYIGDDTETVEFDIEEEGADEALEVGSSSDDPDSTTLKVEEDENSEWYTIFAFELEADDNDIELDNAVIDLTTSDDNIGNVINDLMLVIDDEEFDDYSLSTTTGATAEATFDIDGDYTVEEGESVTVLVKAEFKQQDGNYDSGDTIQASLDDAAIEGEGANDVTSDGARDGDTHVLRTAGIAVELVEATEDTTGENDTIGEFVLEFEVTAFEDTFYMTDDVEEGATTTDGVAFSVDGGSATTSAVLASSADEISAGVFELAEGETETFTLTVTVDPDATGQFRVQLEEVNITTSTDGTGGTMVEILAVPEADFRSGYETIQGS